MANPRFNRALGHLLSELNAAQVPYPGTTPKFVYRLVVGRTNWNTTHSTFRPAQEF